MKKLSLILMLFIFISTLCYSMSPAPEKKTDEIVNPKVMLLTSKGKILIELFPDKAPITVDNFLSYIDSGFYDGTIFHRVIPGFMIQGGGFKSGMIQKLTAPPIKNEANNGLSNKRGTIAMARTNIIDSATSQFFINIVDNNFLDHKNDSPQGYGYCVFGRVIDGMDVADEMVSVRTKTEGYHQNVPVEEILILSAGKIE